MEITVDLPQTLIGELWAFHRPRDEFAREKAPCLTPCSDLETYVHFRLSSDRNLIKMPTLVSNFNDKDAYRKSCEALSSLKLVRSMVDALSASINTSVKRMEKAIRPASRYHGIRELLIIFDA